MRTLCITVIIYFKSGAEAFSITTKNSKTFHNLTTIVDNVLQICLFYLVVFLLNLFCYSFNKKIKSSFKLNTKYKAIACSQLI